MNKQQDKTIALSNTQGDLLSNTNPHHNKNKLGNNKPKSSYYKNKNKNDVKLNGDEKVVANKPKNNNYNQKGLGQTQNMKSDGFAPKPKGGQNYRSKREDIEESKQKRQQFGQEFIE